MGLLMFMLKALEYPGIDEMKPNDEVQFRKLVDWLECFKIRLYKTEERKLLKAYDHREWNDEFRKYLGQLECPLEFDQRNPTPVLEWLVQWALQYEYKDNAENYNALGDELANSWDESGNGARPLPDVGSTEVQDKLLHLCRILKIEEIPASNAEKAKVIQERLEYDVLPATNIQSKGQFQLKNYPLGFTTGDKELDKAAILLRMLYVKDLRQLQSKIDETIIQVQEFTANPRTDASLGKVGR